MNRLFESLFAPDFASQSQQFVFRFIQIIDTDKDIRKTVNNLLQLNSFHRSSKINTITNNLKLKNAPQEIVQCFRAMTNDEFCSQLKARIKQSQ